MNKKKKLDHLKQQYEDIQIPKDLKQKVKSSIEAGKSEKEKSAVHRHCRKAWNICRSSTFCHHRRGKCQSKHGLRHDKGSRVKKHRQSGHLPFL